MRKYQIVLNNRITLRAKEDLNKTESFGSQKQGAGFSLCTVNFAMIAKIHYDRKFRYHSENSVIVKTEIFAMHSNFRYDREFSL